MRTLAVFLICLALSAQSTRPPTTPGGTSKVYVDVTGTPTINDCAKFTGASTIQSVACSSGGGVADPGSNGIMKRTALNVTAPAVAGTDFVTPAASNTYTTGDQDMSAATAFRLPTATLGTTAGRVRYNATSGRMEWYDAVGGAVREATFLPSGLAANDVLFASSSTALGRSANITWNNSTQVLTITTPSGSAGISVAGGYINAAEGYRAGGNVLADGSRNLTTGNVIPAAASTSNVGSVGSPYSNGYFSGTQYFYGPTSNLLTMNHTGFTASDNSRTRLDFWTGGTSGNGQISTYDTTGTTIQNQINGSGINTVVGYSGTIPSGSTSGFVQLLHGNANFNWGSSAGGAIRFYNASLANSPDAEGTVIAGNLPSGFTGNWLDLQTNSVGALRVTSGASADVLIPRLTITTNTYGSNAAQITGANGRFNLYNTETTGQAASNGTMGVPYFRNGASVTSASNSGTVTIITPVSGALYRLSYYCYVTTAEAARTATVVIGWTDDTTTAQTATVCNAVSTNTLGTTVSGTQLLVTNTTVITYALTYTGGSTGVLRLRYTLERLQ